MQSRGRQSRLGLSITATWARPVLLGLHGTEHVLAARLVIAVGTDLEPTRAAVWDLLAATPTCQWLEYVDWAAPVLKEPIEIRDGHAIIPNRPGAGIEWNEEAVKRYGATVR